VTRAISEKRRLIMAFVVKRDVKPLPDTELWLEDRYDGVRLRARRGEGAEWNILSIDPDGIIRRYIAVPSELGFRMDHGVVMVAGCAEK